MSVGATCALLQPTLSVFRMACELTTAASVAVRRAKNAPSYLTVTAANAVSNDRGPAPVRITGKMGNRGATVYVLRVLLYLRLWFD